MRRYASRNAGAARSQRPSSSSLPHSSARSSSSASGSSSPSSPSRSSTPSSVSDPALLSPAAEALWKRAARNLVHQMGPFFPGDVLVEIEPRHRILSDQFRRTHRHSTPLVVGAKPVKAPLAASVRADPLRLPLADDTVYHMALHLWDGKPQRVLREVLRVTGPSGKLYIVLHGERALEAKQRLVGLLKSGDVERIASKVLVRARGGTHIELVTGRVRWSDEDEPIDDEAEPAYDRFAPPTRATRGEPRAGVR